MATIILEPDEAFAHTHANASRSQCVEGVVTMAYEGFEKILRSGDAVTVPAGIEHVLTNIGPGPARIDCAHSPRRCATASGSI